MFTLTEENLEKIREIDKISDEGFQELFEAFLDDSLALIAKARQETATELSEGTYLPLSKPQDFRFSNPKEVMVDGQPAETIPAPAYLSRKKSWARIFHVFLTKIKERHGIGAVIPYLQNLDVKAVQGDNASAKTGTTLGGWTHYPDLGISVRLSGGEGFQPVIHKIAEKEKIPYNITVSWADRDSVPEEQRGQLGQCAFAPVP